MQTTQAKKHKFSLTLKRKPSAWKCSCGCAVPKKAAVLSGGPQYKQGYHVHCPRCGKIIAQYIDPKENQ